MRETFWQSCGRSTTWLAKGAWTRQQPPPSLCREHSRLMFCGRLRSSTAWIRADLSIDQTHPNECFFDGQAKKSPTCHWQALCTTVPLHASDRSYSKVEAGETAANSSILSLCLEKPSQSTGYCKSGGREGGNVAEGLALLRRRFKGRLPRQTVRFLPFPLFFPTWHVWSTAAARRSQCAPQERHVHLELSTRVILAACSSKASRWCQCFLCMSSCIVKVLFQFFSALLTSKHQSSLWPKHDWVGRAQQGMPEQDTEHCNIIHGSRAMTRTFVAGMRAHWPMTWGRPEVQHTRWY